MISYLLSKFEHYSLEHISITLNTNTDALAHFASASNSKMGRLTPVELFPEPSIARGEQIMVLDVEGTWMEELVKYLRDGSLPLDQLEARKLKSQALKYYLNGDILYKVGYS